MARKEEQEPTITHTDRGDTYNHPAYGMLQLTTPTGGDVNLFGSDIGHNQRVCIRVCEANLHRDLSNDWIHDNKIVCEVELSHAQFAAFIMSAGKGSGTPCTLKYTRNGNMVSLPAIKKVQTKYDLHKKEIRDVAKEAMNKIVSQLADMQEEINKIPTAKAKKTMQEKLNSIASSLKGVPNHLEFVLDQAEEALEHATNDAKIEVESYVAMTAQRIGLQRIEQFGQLEHLTGDSDND